MNSCYLIKVANYIVNPSENYTLAENWNKGIIPKTPDLKVYVSQIMGKMIKVDAICIDDNGNELNQVYTGLWLPSSGIISIKELKV